MKKVLTYIIILILGVAIGYFGPGVLEKRANTNEVQDQSAEDKEVAREELDKNFLEGMVEKHEESVAMARAVLKTTERSELKALASDIVSAQTKEVKIMKDWLRSWFAPNK